MAAILAGWRSERYCFDLRLAVRREGESEFLRRARSPMDGCQRPISVVRIVPCGMVSIDMDSQSDTTAEAALSGLQRPRQGLLHEASATACRSGPGARAGFTRNVRPQ
jgi:hypothetical protein